MRGTPVYMAPEMIDQGDEGFVARSSRSTDMYAFAMVCYFVLTGNIPFAGKPEAVVYMHALDSFFPNGFIVPLPVLRRCLAHLNAPGAPVAIRCVRGVAFVNFDLA